MRIKLTRLNRSGPLTNLILESKIPCGVGSSFHQQEDNVVKPGVMVFVAGLYAVLRMALTHSTVLLMNAQ